jgi:hypothetical protein
MVDINAECSFERAAADGSHTLLSLLSAQFLRQCLIVRAHTFNPIFYYLLDQLELAVITSQEAN